MNVILGLLLGCTDAEVEPEMTVAEAAEEVTFATVEALGAHRFLGTITRTDRRHGEVDSVHDETIDLAWQDWDRFRFRRLVDGRSVSDVVVVDGVPYVRKSTGTWAQKQDAEPYRLQLRSTWNVWEQAMEIFDERLALSEPEDDVVEGRLAFRYEVSLAIPEGGAPSIEGQFAPVSISGSLWVDSETAVRLVADVKGRARQGPLNRAIHLKLSRSSIGADQEVRPPGQGGGD